MSQCPVCSAELIDDFGLVTCGSCQSPLLIQMDGSVERQEIAAAMEATVIAPPPSAEAWQLPGDDIVSALLDEASDEIVPPSDFSLEPQVPSTEDFLLQESVEPQVDNINQNDLGAVDDLFPGDPPGAPPNEDPEPEPEEFPELPGEEEPPPPPEEPPTPPAPPEVNSLEAMEAFFDSEQGPPPAVVTNAPAVDLTDMTGLANSMEAGASGFHYAVTVTGIDTAEIRTDFRERLTDKRFLWDTEQILRSIQNGKVRIDTISAVKTFLLVHRLRELPVRVVWEQNAR